MAAALDLHTSRARQARAGRAIGKTGAGLLTILAVLLVAGGIALIVLHHHYGISLLGLGLLVYMPAAWWQRQLKELPVTGSSFNDRLAVGVLTRLKPKTTYTPRTLWQALTADWQVIFLCNHLLIPGQLVAEVLGDDAAALPAALNAAEQLAADTSSQAIEPYHIAAGLLLSSPAIHELLSKAKLGDNDVRAVAGWLARGLAAMRRERPRFGGIARDWTSGFTPRLERFGHNLSQEIERHSLNFGSLAESQPVQAVTGAFRQGATALALIGPDGIGKTSAAYALAQNLLAEDRDPTLKHQQVIGLDASAIISVARHPGELEYIVSSLLNEAVHAGNVVLFIDDAHLFLSGGTGAFDASQLLLPALQSRAIRIVLALAPAEYQQLKSFNASLAGLITPIMLKEPDEATTLEILADNAAGLETHSHCLIAYEALKEAYRLSQRYDQDAANPGKAIRLLEQSLSHADNGLVNAASVQAAIEQATGVKASSAAPAEADQLLHLEDEIHQRMINQSRAVSVVSNALRRARAGVASPNRPIGSFLFLGPTGVGKTELAKSIAAVYFGDEARLIRLDMSEYQRPEDVARLLSSGQGETSSLILQVRQQPFSVVLLDEIEKAHPNILNLLLQLLDEGQLTDSQGRATSFKDAIVITTSNAGADTIRQKIEQGAQLEDFEQQFTDELINSGQFKPELLNRFDEIVLFRPLKPDELAQVVRLMLAEVNQNLAKQNIAVELTDAAINKIVEQGNDPRLGARPMRRAIQRLVEDTVAQKILAGAANPGDKITLDAPDLSS